MLANRDPERPFDTKRPRNWGSFGAEWFNAVNGFFNAVGIQNEGVVSDAFWEAG